MSIMNLFGFGGRAAARAPDDDFWYNPLGFHSHAGVRVSDDIALTYSAVWAATRLLSSTGGCLPLNLKRQRMVNGRKMKEVATGHPVQRLLHSAPNEEMGARPFRMSRIQQQVNAGNCFAEIERAGLRPVRLWPIDSSRIPRENLVRDSDTGELTYLVKNNVGNPTPIPARDMFHVTSTMLDPSGLWGRGVIENARETIGMGLTTERHGASFMKNNAKPHVVIIGGKFKDENERQEYRKEWAKVHGGATNTGTPALLPTGVDIKTLDISQEDAQFLQTRQHNVEEIARWYGVPPHMIQHLLRATFNNIEHMGIEFVIYSLLPWLTLWEDQVALKLLTERERDEYFAKHEVNGLLRGDTAARQAFYQAMWQMGVFSQNDIRDLEDMNPFEGGDTRWVPVNYTSIEKALQAPAKPVATQVPAPTADAALSEGEPMDVDRLIAALSDRMGEAVAMQAEMHRDTIQQAIAELPPTVGAVDIATELATIIGPMFERAAVSTEPVNLSAVDRELAREILADTIRWLARKEIHAAAAAAKSTAKQPAKWFAWFDGYYEAFGMTFTKHASKPLRLVSPGCDAAAIASWYVSTSREAVLTFTDGVMAEQWPCVVERMEAAEVAWTETRVVALLNYLSEPMENCDA